MGKENFNGQFIGANFNDSTVIGVTNKNDIQSQFGYIDSVALKASDYVDDRTSLGMLELFENARIVNVPFIKDALKNSDKIYVNGIRGSFDYEIAMEIEKPCVVQNVEEGDYLGIDGSFFDIKLSHPFSPGDILTYDPVDGEQVIVIEDSEVVDEGDGYVHTVQLVTRDRSKYFPSSKLKPGTEYVKIDHVAGEFDSQYSAPNIMGLSENSVRLQYTLGDYRAVQVGYSAYADVLTVNGKEASFLTERIQKMQDRLGGDYFFVGQVNPKSGKLLKNTVRVQPIMEALAMAELMKLTAMGMMFDRGATITGINGSKIINEGLYHQLRRGHRFIYKNVNELRQYIQRAAEIIYHGTSIQIHDRRMVFKAGFNAHNLVRELFKEEFKNTTPVHIDQEALPVKILSGNDRYNLQYQSYAIGEAFLNGIGTVRVEHDPSLDYDSFGDYISRGYSAGLSKRSWTLVMWDISDPMYSNIFDRSVFPKGVEIDNASQGTSNLYIVKPKNVPDFSYGSTNGPVFEQGFTYSRPQPGREFTCMSSMSAWIPDKSRVVMIEKLETNDF